jgi:adenylate cyclase
VSGTAARILVVDDDADSREVLVRRLAAHGYDVLQADRGDGALALARAERPDLILLDVLLPGVDGLHVARELKADAALPFMPIILVTGRSDVRDVVAGLEAGGDEYLTKPVDAAALLARVQSMLRIKALTDTVRAQATQLQRFVPPQVAQLVVSAGQEQLLESHRREVAIVVARIAGFTVLSESAAPEDVMAVLAEFHRAMGELTEQSAGTLERFTGDGLKVLFNDPLPCVDPAGEAVRLALAMRDRARALFQVWQQRGYPLGFSAAVALGYATLGVIGFAGRSDYASIGLVSDLASGLCAAAGPDQVLATQRVLAMVEHLLEYEANDDVQLPESRTAVPVFSMVRLKAEAGQRWSTPLSPREQEVALLVAEGLTNRQIAERLVVTEATAAKHLENILNKLGLSSRTQVAGWVHAAPGRAGPRPPSPGARR